MIRSMTCQCTVQGAAFSPRAFEEHHKIRFEKSHEPGAIGDTGRYKGIPQPFGWGEVALPCNPGELLDRTIDVLAKTRIELSATGGTAGLYIVVGYEGQCNFEFAPDYMAALARVGCPICITCYEEEEGEAGTNLPRAR